MTVNSMPSQQCSPTLEKRSPPVEIGSMGVECGAPAQWSGCEGLVPHMLLDDQSTDEGSTHSGDVSRCHSGDVSRCHSGDVSRRQSVDVSQCLPGDVSSVSTTEAVPHQGQHPHLKEHDSSTYTFDEVAAWIQASEWSASSFEGPLVEPVGAAQFATSPWTTSPWDAQGSLENQIPPSNSCASFLSTAPPAFSAAPPQTPMASTVKQTSVLGTAPLGHGVAWCTFMGGPAPQPVRAPPIFADEELPPCGPNDAPLKVPILDRDLDTEVVPLDPRYPAKKRPPVW